MFVAFESIYWLIFDNSMKQLQYYKRFFSGVGQNECGYHWISEVLFADWFSSIDMMVIVVLIFTTKYSTQFLLPFLNK